MREPLTKRLREHATGGQDCSHVNAPLVQEAADAIDGLITLLRWARAGDDKEKNLHGYIWRDRVDGMLSEVEPVSSSATDAKEES